MSAYGFSKDYSAPNTGTATQPTDIDAGYIIVGSRTWTTDCPNCGVVRHVDEDGYVEPCKNCDDDEWNIWEVEGKP